jgi:hypothetical protein
VVRQARRRQSGHCGKVRSGDCTHAMAFSISTIGLVAIVLAIFLFKSPLSYVEELASYSPSKVYSSSIPTAATTTPIANTRRYQQRIQEEVNMSDAKIKAAERKKQFLEVWPRLETELVDMMRKHAMPEDATEWFKRVRFPSS